MRVCVLGSGSSGNCVYIGNGRSAMLIDAGFSGRETLSRLREAGLDPESIRAVVVSHEHGDHVRGVGVVCRKLDAPVFVNEKTHTMIKNVIGRVPGAFFFETGKAFEAAGFELSPFSIPHDAADPCAFTISDGTRRAAVLTDAGTPTMLMEEKMRDADYLVIESNHDPDMLMAGPYPWVVKQRIASRLGHLSNEACAGLLGKALGPRLQGVTFAHLSQTNNNRDIVRLVAEQALSGPKTPFDIARQDRPGAVVNIE
ncbi:MAG: MBL fold metallo-hydrolase [Candidatus Nitrospinota bacterium M3_3B_026]